MSDANTDGASSAGDLSPRKESRHSDYDSKPSNTFSASDKSGSDNDSDGSDASGSPKAVLGRKRRLLKKRKKLASRQRRKKFGESSDEDETSKIKTEKAKPKASQGDSGNEYDSSGDDIPDEDDERFIDRDGDDDELLAEYSKDVQSFRDEKPSYSRKKGRDSEDISGEVRARGGRKKMMLTDEQKRQMVRKILGDMFAAAAADIRDRAMGKPAVAKLRLLPEVQAAVSNNQLHEFLLEGTMLGADSTEGSDTILKAFHEWLRPLPGTNLPALHLRENILQMIDRLNVSIDHLKSSNLGPILYALMSHPDETEKNKALLKKMIDGFSRKIYGRSTSIREGRTRALEIQEKIGIVTPAGSTASIPITKPTKSAAKESAAPVRSPVDSLLGDDLVLPEETDEQQTHQEVARNARIPQPLVMDYVRMPSERGTNSVVPMVPMKTQGPGATQLHQRLKLLRRTGKR